MVKRRAQVVISPETIAALLRLPESVSIRKIYAEADDDYIHVHLEEPVEAPVHYLPATNGYAEVIRLMRTERVDSGPLEFVGPDWERLAQEEASL